LGYGYGGFWVASSARVDFIWAAAGWNAPHAHNGWIDVLLDLGIVGLVMAALQMILVLVNGIRTVIDGREPDASFLVMAAFILLLENMSESELIRPGISWVLLVVSVVVLGRVSMARRLERRQLREARLNEVRMRERFGFGPSVIANR
jgi:exopolysaccharide production protein ExoQ